MTRPVAFITGASRGIGRGIAIELAKQGYDLAGNSRAFDKQNIAGGIFEVKERIEELGASFLPLQGDVASLDDHEQMLELILERYGRIDLLVNNAGVAPEKRFDVLETTTASFDRVLGINLRGPFFLTQQIARQMIAQAQAQPEACRALFSLLPYQLICPHPHAPNTVCRKPDSAWPRRSLLTGCLSTASTSMKSVRELSRPI